ncbi:MAG: sulfite exporter TauE/SafE family protein [candidate division Zixibacteria bacterium]|nr:sulfite exporter TauE/SafE family protein [candidate division Zixibacteria bacterium]
MVVFLTIDEREKLDIIILILATILAGFIGSILGLGGGIVLVPFLTLIFDFPISSAVGTSLVAIVITSAGASSVYLSRGQVSIPAAYRLELFTVLGATIGGLSAKYLPAKLIAVTFGIVLLFTAYNMIKSVFKRKAKDTKPESNKTWNFNDVNRKNRIQSYGGSVAAGIVSALLGVGGGVLKVPILNLILGAPIRVSVATSALMIGITASAGAVHYIVSGHVNPITAMIVAASIFIGARSGAIIAARIKVEYIRTAFGLILIYTAIRMFLL